MRRRDAIKLLGGVAASVLVTNPALAQSVMPVIGFLRSAPFADAAHLVRAFGAGLKDAGFIHGQNVTIEYRSGENDPARLAAQVRELIGLPVAVLVANVVAAVAAK